MNIDTPITSADTKSSHWDAVRRLTRHAGRWWKDLRAGGRKDEAPLALKPFCFWPGKMSLLSGEGGTEPVPVAGYAFHTEYVPSMGGRMSFEIQLTGLAGSRGELLLHINGIAEDATSLPQKVISVPIDKLVAAGGRYDVSRLAERGNSFALLGTLTPDSDARADRIDITVKGADSSDALAVRLDAAKREFLAAPGKGVLKKIIVQQRATLDHPVSQMCTSHQMDEPVYAEWCARFGNPPVWHRKQWEFVFILRALDYHGALRAGSRGLGFGVGIEPLSSLFASMGCLVTATDLAADDDRAQAWNDTYQLGSNLRQIHIPHLCDETAFYEQVSYRAVDMNAIPADLTNFDFTWSSCAFEHLGSIEAGLQFFQNSLKCLKPGGIAVHTTELNLSSNSVTLDNNDTVIFRRRDFETLAERLIAEGHDVMPITFDSGDGDMDRVIDLPPYSNDPHLKLQLMRWVTTSFGMIVRKRA